MINSDQDRVYAERQASVDAFEFDETVARVFPNMIERSVPGYRLVLSMTARIAARYARPHTRLYDLGCSLGAAVTVVRHAVTAPGCRIVALDSSPAMVERCAALVAADSGGLPVEVVCADMRDTVVTNASVVLLNFSLQFVAIEDRLPLLRAVRQGLCPGGCLVLSEKIVFAGQDNAVLVALHEDFKRANGYSDLEIAQKRAALEHVLLPESLQTHRQRLLEAGFRQVVPWYQGLNFCSLLALA